jgi:hypothetical protein
MAVARMVYVRARIAFLATRLHDARLQNVH